MRSVTNEQNKRQTELHLQRQGQHEFGENVHLSSTAGHPRASDRSKGGGSVRAAS